MIMEGKKKDLFSKHLTEQKFIYDKYNLLFRELYDYLQKKQFPQRLFSIEFYEKGQYYFLTNYFNCDVFYFFTYLIDLELINMKTKTKDIVKVCSTYEIFSLINKNKNFSFYLENKKIIKNNIIPKIIKNNKITLNYYEDKIDKVYFNEVYLNEENENLSPFDLSNNFYSYFPEQNTKEKILYIRNNERGDIGTYINLYFDTNKIIKLTGPSGIGKSLFLLYFSRKSFHHLYLNLGALDYLNKQKEIIKLLNMIINELNRLCLDESNIKELNNFFENLTNVNIDTIIKQLINTFINSHKKIFIILDQFKEQYFYQWNEVENLVNDDSKNTSLYLIICSSINDKNIKKSCCSVINYCDKTKKKNDLANIKGQYFYISKILNKDNSTELYNDSEYDKISKDLKEKIIEYFDGIPKYVLKILKSKNISKEINEINKRIKKKFKNFYGTELKEIELQLKLASLKRYIGYKIPMDKFDEVISNFSFKYFTLTFYNDDEEINFLTEDSKINYFKIDYLFPYISEIVEELALNSNDMFFDYSLFENHTGSTIGGFLELIAINKIKNNVIMLPQGGFDCIICVDRINEMTEIKLRMNDVLKNEIKLQITNEKNKKDENIISTNSN